MMQSPLVGDYWGTMEDGSHGQRVYSSPEEKHKRRSLITNYSSRLTRPLGLNPTDYPMADTGWANTHCGKPIRESLAFKIYLLFSGYLLR